MKMIIAAFLVALSSGAHGASVEASGKVFYKMPAGEMVERDASIVVPERGQGDVILKGGGLEFKADRFFTRETNGAKIFYVVLSQFPGAAPGDVAVYRGVYTRGTNVALYYGNVFVGKSSEFSDDGLHQQLSLGDGREFTYSAGFYFKAPISGAEISD